MIYAAPAILTEAAFNAALAGALARKAKRRDRRMGGKRLPRHALAATTGWYAHKHCPMATRLRDAVSCGER